MTNTHFFLLRYLLLEDHDDLPTNPSLPTCAITTHLLGPSGSRLDALARNFFELGDIRFHHVSLE
jgi:hypothetical protein